MKKKMYNMFASSCLADIRTNGGSVTRKLKKNMDKISANSGLADMFADRWTNGEK